MVHIVPHRPQKEPTLATTLISNFYLLQLEDKNFCFLSLQFVIFSYGSPRKLNKGTQDEQVYV